MNVAWAAAVLRHQARAGGCCAFADAASMAPLSIFGYAKAVKTLVVCVLLPVVEFALSVHSLQAYRSAECTQRWEQVTGQAIRSQGFVIASVVLMAISAAINAAELV